MFVFNPLSGKLEIKEGGYTGNLRDSAGQIIATVRNGLIKTVFYAQSSPSPSEQPQGIGQMAIGSTFIIG